MKARVWLVVVPLLVCLAAGTAAAVGYTITDLETLPGGTCSWAYGINDTGQIVGASGTACLWQPGGSTEPGGPFLPPNPPEGTTRRYLTGQLHAHWMEDNIIGNGDLTPELLEAIESRVIPYILQDRVQSV
jgi:hypothetical protein